ncbi:MAG TPA: bifunctional adenosylcobinamide kinase/adenosylcobinamide-phosphate guanylyltransferase [Gaiellaceae bacterium]|nr:bifunctional adenosylcobinamide kinase/adenosylcobinamide-phosphate guanylyltransferase [Gaiellaceae bacterium]
MGLVFLLGGARSGKSALALRLARAQPAPVVWLATAEAGDAEMAARIARHRNERPEAWVTVEEPLRLREALERIEPAHCLIVDCLTLWTANALERLGAAATATEAAAAAQMAAARTGMTVAISNEVGLGLVPASELGRTYRDVLGRVNALWAGAAEYSYLVIAGRALPLVDVDSLLELA